MALAWPLTARGVLFEHLGRLYADPEAGGVVLTGPAGVGKTRLGTELLAAAGDRPTAQVIGHPATQSIPLGAMAHLLPADLTTGIGVGDDDRATLFHRARRQLAIEAGQGRTLLVVDDVDQLDEMSLAVLMPFTIDRRIFLVATVRTGRPLPRVIASLLKDEHLLLEALPPLRRDEIMTLLHRVLDGPLDTDAVERLAAASQGNLQILKELVNVSLEQGSLRMVDDLWCLADLPASATLEELVASQIADLEPVQSHVVEMLAVAGRLGLADADDIAGPDVLLELERRGLIVVEVDDRRRRVIASHPIYGEMVRSRLSVLRERELLRSVADRIEGHGARRRGDVMQLARWRLDAGGDISGEALVVAGRLAILGRDPTLAARFAAVAADQGREHDAALIQIEAAVLRADADAAERIVATMWDDAALPDGHRSHLARRLARLRFARGDLDGALGVLRDAEDRVTAREPTAAVRAEQALLLASNGRPAAALRLIAEIGDVDDLRTRLDLANARSIACLTTGRMSEAIAAARRGAQMHEELPDWLGRGGAASHVINEAHALGYSGRYEEARALATDALTRARDSGANAAVVWFEVVLGEIARDSGHGHDAVRHFGVATELADHAGQQAALVWAWVGVAQGHLLVGEVDPAARALEMADSCTSPVATSWSTRERTRAWLKAAQGDLAGARALLADLIAAIEGEGMLNFEAGVVHDLVRFGDPAAAIERLVALSHVVEGPYMYALVTHARAAVEQDVGLFDAAVGEFEAMECLVLAAEAATEAAELLARAGDRRGAAATGQRALHFVERAGGARTPGLLRGSGVEPLTLREREVALLAASGASSKQIAARLIVSKRTVDSHLDRVYRKLGVSGRDQLAEALTTFDPARFDSGATR